MTAFLSKILDIKYYIWYTIYVKKIDGAVGGILTLDSYKSIANSEDIPTIEELCKDEELCFSLDMDVQDKIFMAKDVGEIEAGVCEKYIDRYRKEHDSPVKSGTKYLD